MPPIKEDPPPDFVPVAREHLEALQAAIQQAQEPDTDPQAGIEQMNAAVIQLKTHASNFQYILLGHLINIILTFLDGAQRIDRDVISFMQASHKVLHVVVANNIRDAGGQLGQDMEAELKAASQRYFDKQG